MPLVRHKRATFDTLCVRMSRADIRETMIHPEPSWGIFEHQSEERHERLLFVLGAMPGNKKQGRDVRFFWIDEPEPYPFVQLHFAYAYRHHFACQCPTGCGRKVLCLYTAPHSFDLACRQCRGLSKDKRQRVGGGHMRVITAARRDPLEFVRDRMDPARKKSETRPFSMARTFQTLKVAAALGPYDYDFHNHGKKKRKLPRLIHPVPPHSMR